MITIKRVVEVVEQAGEVITSFAKQGFDVQSKGGQGPVTSADLAADQFLKRELRRLDPCAWLSEETVDDKDRLTEDRLWVVDPLDGTKEFVQGIPEYTIAVALTEGGVPVLGVVHNPATGETYYAERGRGAFDATGAPVRTRNGSTLLASRSEVRSGEFGSLVEAWEVKQIGSIEYKLALVAAGRGAATVSRGPKWEWDVCAGALLVHEAGGCVSDVFGHPFSFNQTFPKVKGVLAGHREAYDAVLEAVTRLGPSERMLEFKDVELI